ncbi:MAG TPA: type II secretion system F family protein, partial [Acidimicrobiia bacterium]|nr:type II secretion system F family protein [Acidimicrobiia bacterium]
VLPAIVAGAVLAFAMAMMLMHGDNRTDLEKRLTGHVELPEEGKRALRGEQMLAETRLVHDMAEFTGRIAERVGLLARVEEKLEQADLPVRPTEAIFFYCAAVFVVFLGSLLVLGVAPAFILTLLTLIGPLAFLELRRKKRLKSFETQLPDVLNLFAGSMRAGFSFAQALEAVAEEAPDPSRRELARCFTESRLGRPIEDALEDSANRMHSVDLMWAVMAIRIQREVGGNLAELLDTVARTMMERERLHREIAALTAEGRLSAWILGIFPPAFALVLYVIQPQYMSVLFQNGIGIIAVGVSAVMAVFGFFWLRNLMQIEV